MDINYIVDAKSEYTKQLQTLLVPRIYEGIESIYDDANYNNTMNVLHTFQKLLREIPKWNKDIIDGETNRILEVTQCEWLENLLTAVFVSNTKILTAIKIKDHDGKIDITIPRLSHFIHRCYVEVARELYKNPYLLDKTNNSVKEKQQNLRETLGIIETCIEDAIRSLLPIQSLLKEYLGNININKDKQIGGDEEQDDIEDDEEEQDEEEQEEQEEQDEQDEEEVEQINKEEDIELDDEEELDKIKETSEDEKLNKESIVESNPITKDQETKIEDKEVELKGGNKEQIEKSRSKYKVNELDDDLEESDHDEITIDQDEDIVVDDIDLENSETEDEQEEEDQEQEEDEQEEDEQEEKQEEKQEEEQENPIHQEKKRVEEPKQDLGVVNIEEKIEKKEEIKNIKIDNHLLPKSLQRRQDDHVGSGKETIEKEIPHEEKSEEIELEDEIAPLNNVPEKHIEDDTRSVNSDFIRNGLKKVKKKKPKLILRKKVPVDQSIEKPRVESNNRYDFW